MDRKFTLLGPSAPGFQTQTTFSLQIFMTDNNGNDVQVGTATNATITQRRSTTPIGGVGIGDRMMERVPGRSEYTLTLTKFALWRKPLQNILGYAADVRMIAEMQRPFDVRMFLINPNEPDKSAEAAKDSKVDYTTERSNVIAIICKGCVITDYTRRQEYSTEVVIVDEVTCDVTAIIGNENNLPPLSNLV